MKYKRIMLLSHEMTYTGAPNSLLNMASVLKRHGHSVSVFTLNEGEFSKEFKKRGFRVKRLNEGSFDYSSVSAYDLVIANTVFCGGFALKAQQYAPVVIYIREAHDLPDIIYDCGLDSECISRSENVFCVSEYAENYIRTNYKVKNLSVIHNFLEVSFLYRPRKNILRDGKVHFLAAGTIEKRKGIDVALEAIELLPVDIRQRAVLHIAGKKPEWSGKYWEKLDFDIPGVIYHGEITDKREMFRLYDSVNCVIVPSFDESCSLTALEGAMHGRALILSENVGAKYIAANSGFIVKTGSAGSLAEAMSFIIKESSELEYMGENSYRNFMETSTSQIYYKNFIKAISGIKR